MEADLLHEFLRTGGDAGVIVIALVMLIKFLAPYLRKPKDNDITPPPWAMFQDMHNDLHGVLETINSQNDTLKRIAESNDRIGDSLQSLSGEFSGVKTQMDNLPDLIAKHIKNRGNGKRAN